MHNIVLSIIFALGLAAYVVNVGQIIRGHYSPSFFSRAVWFLLGINSFGSVLRGDGSTGSVVLAAILLVGNAIVCLASYKNGSREFGVVEKVSLVLLIVSGLAWAILNAPFVGLIIGLIAHFIGGAPTIWRVVKNPSSERAYHWYFFFAASVITILSSNDKHLPVILFPLYFPAFDGLIVVLANRNRVKLFNRNFL